MIAFSERSRSQWERYARERLHIDIDTDQTEIDFETTKDGGSVFRRDYDLHSIERVVYCDLARKTGILIAMAAAIEQIIFVGAYFGQMFYASLVHVNMTSGA